MAVDLEELAARARRDAEPAWNEVREQRVLATLSRPRARRSPRLAWLATGALALAVAILAVLVGWPEPARSGWIELEDGSVCALDLGARVRVEAQERELVRLEQERGRVVYEVSHRPERAFEVHAAPVVVRVRGTRFAVEVTREIVRVSVEEGRVEVEARGRLTLLTAGDALRVARRPGDLRRQRSSDAVSASEERGAGGARGSVREALERDAAGEVGGADEGRGRDAELGVADHAAEEIAADERGVPGDGVERVGAAAVDEGPAPAASPRRARAADRAPRRHHASARSDGLEPNDGAPVADGLADPSGADGTPPVTPSAAELLGEADAARRASDWAAAAVALERVLRDHAGDPRAPSAAFTLGRVRRRLGQLVHAARAFEQARLLAPDGALAEDALAEEASSWRDAGEATRAADAARRYLDRYPGGLHATRMRALTGL